MLSELKDRYWRYHKKKLRGARLNSLENRVLAEHLKDERERVLSLAKSEISYENEGRARAAVDWLLLAQRASPDDGVSQGYFPLSEGNAWRNSYPETTGYIITSLLDYGAAVGDDEVIQAALKMADWEIEVQITSGAVQGGVVCSPEEQTPAAFNTGMVTDGWMTAYEHSGDDKYLRSAYRAASFLSEDLAESGFFRSNGEFVRGGEVKTYTCLCAWPMYRLALAKDDDTIKASAIRCIEAALLQRNDCGWFKNNCLSHSNLPLTHTIGYALQGIFEVGVLAGRQDFVEAVELSLEGALSSMGEDGYLAGRLNDKWEPGVDYVCLTGSAQLAVICFRFAEALGVERFLGTGIKLLNFVKATQLMESSNINLIGAIAGSFPLMGEYMMGGYPNWATKYYLDALILQKNVFSGR